jgi:predicted ATPase/signal transduction histidine kinase/DNA-binding response OmpR family regulator
MPAIPGYTITDLLSESNTTNVVRAIRKQDGQQVVIKILLEKAMSPFMIKRFQQEFALGQTLDSPYICSYLAFHSGAEYSAIVQKDINGIELSKSIPKDGYEVAIFLKLALQIVKGLDYLHKQNIIHKDIKSASFIVNIANQQIQYQDLGYTSLLRKSSQDIQTLASMADLLSYMSPEQTGRMNRDIDYRTDFYSLGITFYELLCQTLPFPAKSAIELIHCHLAKESLDLHELKPTIPIMLAKIVSKLLMKNAEDRYQSAQGLLYDLEICQKQFLKTNAITLFELGQHDYSEKFQLSQKLYGREHELNILEESVEQLQYPKPSLLIVSGYSGIGKSVFINEIQKPLTLKNGRFLYGKFDLANRSAAYSVLTQAFEALIKQLLSLDDVTRQHYRSTLLLALGNFGQLVVDIIPMLELVIGKQPSLSLMEPAETKNCFNATFQKFLTVFINKEQPLVLFLDDLQWADTASLDLIQFVMKQPETQYFLFIGAYRDNEVTIDHPAMQMLTAIRQHGTLTKQIDLKPLDEIAMQAWLADSLHHDMANIKPLANSVYQKTQGNPFFIKIFMRALYDEKILTLSPLQQWQWDSKKIHGRSATDNVVSFMVSCILQLSLSAQHVLALASCLGNHFSLAVLEFIAQKNSTDLQVDMQDLLNAGLLHTREKEIYFTHDRIQEAATSLLSPYEKSSTHLKIGRHLQQNLINQPKLIFEVIDHLNLSVDLISAIDERLALAGLNLQAAEKARQTVAYTSGLTYINAGLKCLDAKQLWSTHYELAYALYREKAELEYSASQLDRAEETLKFLLTQARTALEKADIYNLLIAQKTIQVDHKTAQHLGRLALALLNIELPTEEDDLAAIYLNENFAIQHYLEQEPIEHIADRETITDVQKIATLKLLFSLLASTYVSNRPLYQAVTAMAVNLSLQHGTSEGAALCFAFYGNMLCETPETAQLGHAFGTQAVKLCERYNNAVQTCKVFHTVSILIAPWFESLKTCIALANKAFEAGMLSGEMSYAGFSRYHLATLLFFSGTPLDDVLEELHNLEILVRRMQHQFSLDTILCVQEVVCSLSDQKLTAEQVLALENLKNGSNSYALAHRAIFQAKQFYLLGDFQQAYQWGLTAEKLSIYLSAHYAIAVQKFYHMLTIAALYPDATEQEKLVYMNYLLTYQPIFKGWAENCRENHEVRYLLLCAEIAQLQGQFWQASLLYEKAITSAQIHDIPPQLAICYELAGKFWLAQGAKFIASLHLNSAYASYARWGNKSKLAQMKKQYGDYWMKPEDEKPSSRRSSANMPMASASSSLVLDMENVVKASQVFSSNTELDKLLVEMMKIIVETAGAQKGHLFLYQKNKLFVAATYTEQDEIKVRGSPNLEKWEGAQSIVEYVKNSGKQFLSGNATEDPQFGRDHYIARLKIKSVLCMPIVRQDILKGILYVENNLTNGAFTEQRLSILRILTGQMAISLDNARLMKEQSEASEKMLTEQRQRIFDAEKYRQNLEDFIDTVCHEVRNPLHGIYGNTELLRGKLLELEKIFQEASDTLSPIAANQFYLSLAQAKEYLNSLDQCAQQQKIIVDDVLDLSKLENNKIELNPQPFRLKSILKNILQMFATQLLAKNLEVKLDLPENSEWFKADAHRLSQIIINLISNAVKFTQTGCITIAMQTENLSANQVRLHIRVTDTGIGIEKEEQERLFQRFSQANKRTATEFGGSGLGLVITKKLIERMGGTIHVTSKKWHGSSFTFSILADNVKAEEKLVNKSITQHQTVSSPMQTKSLKIILVVEDNPMNQRILVKSLEEKSYLCYTANNGVEALAQHALYQFDLIFMDIEMPIMGGLEAMRQIQSREKDFPIQTPIICLSGNARKEQINEAKEAGAVHYLTKPYHKSELHAAVETYALTQSSAREIKGNKVEDNKGTANPTTLINVLPATLFGQVKRSTSQSEIQFMSAVSTFKMQAETLLAQHYPFVAVQQKNQIILQLPVLPPYRSAALCTLVLENIKEYINKTILASDIEEITVVEDSLTIITKTESEISMFKKFLEEVGFREAFIKSPSLQVLAKISLN